GGAQVLPCRLDVAEEVEALVPAAVEKLGQLDILVNNAGITRDGLAMRMKDEDWAAVIRVDLEAAFRLSRAALRPMMKARHGRIISISSVVGSIGNPGQANYAAAKAGLEGMTRSLAAEVASRNVTVNCVAPGFIASAMTDALTADQKAKMFERIPAGRFGDGADVAAAVVWLASAEGGYVTGQAVHVNGGMHMA
ncbi:MAG: 3-oxoacyl-ACP reductase FabG, partial [Sandaracinobacteroides sp.]